MSVTIPNPIQVELIPHDPFWVDMAEDEAGQLKLALGEVASDIHHIGSTAIPTIIAKPIIDLLAVVRSFDELDTRRAHLEAVDYIWCGELGIKNRVYCYKNEPDTQKRLFQLHIFQQNDPKVEQHLAFKKRLLSDQNLAREYERLKQQCQLKHPNDSHAYSGCKDQWFSAIENNFAQAGQSF